MKTEAWIGINKLLEEGHELGVILSKLLHSPNGQHYGRDLLPELTEELSDLQAALMFFLYANDMELDHQRVQRKFLGMCRWKDNGELHGIREPL